MEALGPRNSFSFGTRIQGQSKKGRKISHRKHQETQSNNCHRRDEPSRVVNDPTHQVVDVKNWIVENRGERSEIPRRHRYELQARRADIETPGPEYWHRARVGMPGGASRREAFSSPFSSPLRLILPNLIVVDITYQERNFFNEQFMIRLLGKRIEV